MHDTHLMFLIKGATTGLTFQSIVFPETGGMVVKFFDVGGNWFFQKVTESGKILNME